MVWVYMYVDPPGKDGVGLLVKDRFLDQFGKVDKTTDVLETTNVLETTDVLDVEVAADD